MRKSGVVVVVVLVFDCCLDLSFLFLYCFYRRLIFCFYPKNFLDFWWFYLSVAFLTCLLMTSGILRTRAFVYAFLTSIVEVGVWFIPGIRFFPSRCSFYW